VHQPGTKLLQRAYLLLKGRISARCHDLDAADSGCHYNRCERTAYSSRVVVLQLTAPPGGFFWVFLQIQVEFGPQALGCRSDQLKAFLILPGVRAVANHFPAIGIGPNRNHDTLRKHFGFCHLPSYHRPELGGCFPRFAHATSRSAKVSDSRKSQIASLYRHPPLSLVWGG
jgi:hypothetical protein